MQRWLDLGSLSLFSSTDSPALPSSMLSVFSFVCHLALQPARPCASLRQNWHTCSIVHFARRQPLRLLKGKQIDLPPVSRWSVLLSNLGDGLGFLSLLSLSWPRPRPFPFPLSPFFWIFRAGELEGDLSCDPRALLRFVGPSLSRWSRNLSSNSSSRVSLHCLASFMAEANV